MFNRLQLFPESKTKTLRFSDLGWAHIFIILQFALQIMLLFPQFGVLRIFIRATSFAISLFLLFWIKKPGLSHAAKGAAIMVWAIMALNFFWHPNLNSITAGLAQCAMYVAILGPLFWVTRLKITPVGFRWLILLLWTFHAISSLVGVLQVYYPEQFQPFISVTVTENNFAGDNLKITLADGTSIFRPSGLTDIPGGAATSGFYALLMGVGLFFTERNLLLRLAYLVSLPIGLFCIYLSQVRSIFVFAVICVLVFAISLARQGKVTQATTLLGGMGGLAMLTLSWAIAIGGESTSERFNTLVADRPEAVYQQNRGYFLESTIRDFLPQYPLGAGLGRWGQIHDYFGDKANPITGSLYVEIQWTGWLFDGGIPLIIAYTSALLLTSYIAWKLALNRSLGEMSLWAGLIFAYNIGALALTFNYALFISQTGMEYWLLNSALFVAAQNYSKPIPTRVERAW